MIKLTISVMIFISFFGLTGRQNPTDPVNWSNKKISEWFLRKEWAAGWSVNPDESINKREFAIAYFRNQKRWEKAFSYLKNSDLTKLETKRVDLDGDNLYATVSEYVTKDEGISHFEAHRKYIDIQYVITGSELINIAPYSKADKVLTPYDDTKDIEFISIAKIVNHKATPSNFFIFFPDDAHRPQQKDGVNATVRKIVIKLRID